MVVYELKIISVIEVYIIILGLNHHLRLGDMGGPMV